MFLWACSEKCFRSGSGKGFTTSKAQILLRMQAQKKVDFARASAPVLHVRMVKCAVLAHGRRPE